MVWYVMQSKWSPGLPNGMTWQSERSTHKKKANVPHFIVIEKKAEAFIIYHLCPLLSFSLATRWRTVFFIRLLLNHFRKQEERKAPRMLKLHNNGNSEEALSTWKSSKVIETRIVNKHIIVWWRFSLDAFKQQEKKFTKNFHFCFPSNHSKVARSLHLARRLPFDEITFLSSFQRKH